MCGIVGILGEGSVVEKVLEGLQYLEYRGYDSAGIGTFNEATGQIEVARTVGRVENLREHIPSHWCDIKVAFGHTRWATHGGITQSNAHPISDGNVAVVHNGTLTNDQILKQELMRRGVTFESQTDTEVIVHLISQVLSQGNPLLKAILEAACQLKGTFACGILVRQFPQYIIAMRRGTSPLLVGHHAGEGWLASDPLALQGVKEGFFLEDGDIAIVERDKISFYDFQGQPQERKLVTLNATEVQVTRAGYDHFFVKEIYEQPQALLTTFQGLAKNSQEKKVHIAASFLQRPVNLIGCGSAYHSALVGAWALNHFWGIPAQAWVASAIKDDLPPLSSGSLSIFISQSGETADTLSALAHAKAQGSYCAALVNVFHSSLARMADVVWTMSCGPEVSVASTKTFTAQVLSVLFLGTMLAQHLTTGRPELKAKIEEAYDALENVSSLLLQALECDTIVRRWASRIAAAPYVIFIGRGGAYPLALEGALKLKELAYVPSLAYLSGELKHGPLALVTQDVPVILCAPGDDALIESNMTTLNEIVARGGISIAITDEKGLPFLKPLAAETIVLPTAHPVVAPIVMAMPLQFLAYEVACILGRDVDRPRNLAKSVTVS